MSTRSVLAIPDGKGWRGRYCHDDGYPSHHLRQLRILVARDGLDAVRTMLTETYAGWASMNASYPDITGVQTDPEADWDTYPYGTAEYYAWAWERSYNDKRFVSVPGYGVAFSSKKITFKGQRNYQQIAEDEWFTQADLDTDTEWAYVLGDRKISIYDHGKKWTLRGAVSYDGELTDERVRVIECGKHYERCSHVASYHFPEAPRTSIRTWLGTGKPDMHDVVALIEIATGERLALSGSGSQGSATDPHAWRSRSAIKTPYWWVSVKEGPDVRAFRVLKSGMKLDAGYSGVVPTAAGDLVVAPGTILR